MRRAGACNASKWGLVDAARDAILMYNPQTSSYSFKEIRYNARPIQNNSPLTTDFWRKELVNCIGYSFLKLLAPTFSINHHARAARYGRLGPTPPEQKITAGLNLRQQADPEALQ